MPNHFHIVAKHGDRPLGWMMQRVMLRAAIRIKRERDVSGHIFGQRYWAEPIGTPAYLRRAIVYAHLNPCKAELCAEPEQYEWSSHNSYLQFGRRTADPFGHFDGLMSFAGESTVPEDVVANYQSFVRFYQERRKSGILGDWLLPGGLWFDRVPVAAHGDQHWQETYSSFDTVARSPRQKVPVWDLAVRILARLDPNVSLDLLRFNKRTRGLAPIRHNLIAALVTAGCGKSAIGRCLDVSPSVVSRVVSGMSKAVVAEE